MILLALSEWKRMKSVVAILPSQTTASRHLQSFYNDYKPVFWFMFDWNVTDMDLTRGRFSFCPQVKDTLQLSQFANSQYPLAIICYHARSLIRLKLAVRLIQNGKDGSTVHKNTDCVIIYFLDILFKILFYLKFRKIDLPIRVYVILHISFEKTCLRCTYP